MENKIVKLDDSALDGISGGSIMVSDDCTTLGRNCTDQYRVLDFNAVISYVNSNAASMSEKTMLANMESLGYIAAL